MLARPQGNAEEGLLLMSMRLMNYTLSTVADTMLAVLASPRQVLAPTSKTA